MFNLSFLWFFIIISLGKESVNVFSELGQLFINCEEVYDDKMRNLSLIKSIN